MRRIPTKLREQLEEEPQVCARRNKDCNGRITWEHVFIYAGKQINEEWAIIFLCWYHHLGEGMDKRINERIAIKKATKKELNKYPRKKWELYKD